MATGRGSRSKPMFNSRPATGRGLGSTPFRPRIIIITSREKSFLFSPPCSLTAVVDPRLLVRRKKENPSKGVERARATAPLVEKIGPDFFELMKLPFGPQILVIYSFSVFSWHEPVVVDDFHDHDQNGASNKCHGRNWSSIRQRRRRRSVWSTDTHTHTTHKHTHERSIRWWHDTPIGGHMSPDEARQVCEGFFSQRFPGLCVSRRSIFSSHSFRNISSTHDVYTKRDDLPIR